MFWKLTFINGTKRYTHQKERAWSELANVHDDVIKHFRGHWSFVKGIHGSPVVSPHKGQWRRALGVIFHLRLNKRLRKSRDASHWRHHRAHYNVTAMLYRDHLSWVSGHRKTYTTGNKTRGEDMSSCTTRISSIDDILVFLFWSYSGSNFLFLPRGNVPEYYTLKFCWICRRMSSGILGLNHKMEPIHSGKTRSLSWLRMIQATMAMT